jgi:hypothetical protein
MVRLGLTSGASVDLVRHQQQSQRGDAYERASSEQVIAHQLSGDLPRPDRIIRLERSTVTNSDLTRRAVAAARHGKVRAGISAWNF